ncbi:MAG TPA: acyl-CoA dehydrogenase family protein [Nevskiaceae bacterium]|nr:acyl-CoA dehydrogenase family protein [Nevskiaceae bacterium]
MIDLEEFRTQTRAWLQANCPEEMRQPERTLADHCWGGRRWKFQSDAQRLWMDRMVAKGWTAPKWPICYGGDGLSREQAAVLAEEMKRIGARAPVANFGHWFLGPALLRFGSAAIKQKFLPPICRGETRWCEGYSEPGAGSDLAGLQTRAEDKGDYFLVNGQKIWTSFADRADWIFCLVRTDPQAPKHQGISLLLFDMDSPGVTTRPIKLISGESDFCQTFFDNVRVPKDQLVGELNGGWTVAKYLLTHERDEIGDEPPGLLRDKALGPLACEFVGRRGSQLADPVLRDAIARLDVDTLAFKAYQEKLRAETELGEGLGAQSALLKYYGTELNKRRYELMMDAAGTAGLEWDSAQTHGGQYAREWLRTKGNSIEGGTSEVMLGIVAKRILGLPDATRGASA